ncbi:ABC transporter permease [Paenibacillus sp. NPDC058071]|uniref:ABC transporter permease n=1 Tax=Paenibacillus sp. NPDC058071 TaxID=3346326 RepID=UPI0036DF5BEA
MAIRMWREFVKIQKFILEFSIKDFKARYLGSFLGVLWAFIQPTIQILIFWFVFQVGFKSMPVDDFPFILWLISAMIPWFFISDSIQHSTNSIVDNSYLVKKVVFRVSILPVAKIYSALYIHLFFIFFMMAMFAIYGYWPSLYNLQILYYLPAASLLILGISWITSSLVIFLKDVGQFISMMLQFGFWLTPIFYSLDIVPERFQLLFKLNPFYYIIDGYRNSFVYHEWFWEHPRMTLYYWVVTLFVLAVGTLVFKKLRPHFADVL